MARVMLISHLGRWQDDRLPLTHMMVDRRMTNESWHFSQHMMLAQCFCCFELMRSARRLQSVVASRSRLPAVDCTRGVKTPCSTLCTHSPYSLFQPVCDDGRQPGDSWSGSLMHLVKNLMLSQSLYMLWGLWSIALFTGLLFFKGPGNKATSLLHVLT